MVSIDYYSRGYLLFFFYVIELSLASKMAAECLETQ